MDGRIDVHQQLCEIGLLKFFNHTLSISVDEFLWPLILMWRGEEGAFLIEGVMLLLEWHDIYFLTRIPIHEI